MKVLLTGATGLIGRALASRLRRDGHEVLAFVRDEARGRQALGAEVELLVDGEAGGAIEGALGGVDAVLNLAGEPVAGGRWTARRKAAIYDSRINLTRRIADALADCSPGQAPRVLVSASAVGFYGDRGSERLGEDEPVGSGFLADVCRDWEEEARSAEDAGVRVVLARIGIVLAREGGALEKMLPAFRAGFGGPLGNGRQFMPWIHLDDLVESLLRALTDERLRGPINCVAPHPVQNRAFSKTLATVLRRPAFLRVPRSLLTLAVGQMSAALLQSQRAEPQRLLDADFDFRFTSLEEALRDILSIATEAA